MPKKNERICSRKDECFEDRNIKSYDENGKAKYVSICGHNKIEVREKMRAARAGTGALSLDEKKTVRQVAEEWLALKKNKVAATTYSRYVEELERSVLLEYADTPIGDITPAKIDAFAKRMAERSAVSGKEAGPSTIQMAGGILSALVDFARDGGAKKSFSTVAGRMEYEPLDFSEVERVCAAAKYNESPEMLAAILALYCGIRPGEACALEWKDIDLDRGRIFVHQSAHRLKASKESNSKTEVQVEEIPTKAHIRTVDLPEEIVGYMRKLYDGGQFVLSGTLNAPMDARTLTNRMERVLDAYKLSEVNFQRLRKTFVEGKADPAILSGVFCGRKREKPHGGTIDRKWLTDEMAMDVLPLRSMVGLSADEMSELLGLSRGSYRQIEGGRRELSWSEYLAFLFLFSYNAKTGTVVDSLGLFPDVLREAMSTNRNAHSPSAEA